MGKPTTQNISFINHFSHPHPLQLAPASSSPPCSACKLGGGNGRIYSCRPCNFTLHESCSKMKQVITHPSHPSHTLNLLVTPVYDGGYFNCDGCGVIGTGFSYQCSRCDFDIHALCAYKPLSIIHKSHPHHNLKLAFHSPYGANKGFSCDVCLKIGKNQWLYRCIPCEFDAHVGCITSPQSHLLQQHTTTHPTGRPQHNRLRPQPMQGPIRPIINPNRPIVQNPPAYGPRTQNNNLGYNSQVVQNEPAGQGGQSFGQGSTDEYNNNGGEVNQEFEVHYEVDEYEGGDQDGEANVEGEDVDVNGLGLEIVACSVIDDGASRSESDFGSSSDSRSQCNDSSDHTDLYPNQDQNGQATRSRNTGRNRQRGGRQGSNNPIRSPRRSQPRSVQNMRPNPVRARGPDRFNGPRDPPMQFNGPQAFNGPNVGPSNVIDNGGNNNNYNEVNGTDTYGGEGYNDGYGESYGHGDCDFGNGGDFVDDGYDQGYDESYGENDYECYSDITGGSESMYDGNESYGTMGGGSQYGGLNDEPNNQYSPMVGPVGGPGMNNQNQFGQAGGTRNMGRRGRGGNTNMYRNGNMNRGAYSTQPRSMGQPIQYGPSGGPNMINGGPNVAIVPNVIGNTMNTMMQGLCQGMAISMLGGTGDNGSGLFGGESGDSGSLF